MLSEKQSDKPNELVYWYWLSHVPYLGPYRFKTLLALSKNDLSRIWEFDREQLLCIRGIDEKIADAILQSKKEFESIRRQVELDRAKAAALTAHILKLVDPEYPSTLQCTSVAPPLLYAKGRVERLNDSSKFLAIVGTRNASRPGLDTARLLAEKFAQRGWVVVSGLAKGIDMAAHQGALEGGGVTVGVLGCGVDVVYPPESKEIRSKVEEQGAVISEYKFQTRPSEIRLKKRNKLTVGMSQAVIIIETGAKGGTMNAVRAAKEQKKPLFALRPCQEGDFEGNRQLLSGRQAIELTPDSALEIVSQHIAPWPQASS